MEEIEIKITITKAEYEGWYLYERGGSDLVKKGLQSDVVEMLRKIGCHDYDLELKIVNP